MTGTLVVIATPIGNLGDLSPRAIKEFAAADLICCEDTRRTGRLLAHAGVASRLMRIDDHTETRAIEDIIKRIAAGERVALVTDAGTPAVSDPGERLVAAVANAGYRVTVVPGPSAVTTALVASGLPASRFVFEGFLPRKGKARMAVLNRLATEERTIVIYESANRTAATLRDLAGVCGPDRSAAVARELTKLHEEIHRGSLTELTQWAAQGVRGEVVLVLTGCVNPEPADDAVIMALEQALGRGMSTRDAVDEVAGDTGIGRNRVYRLALAITDQPTANAVGAADL